MSFSSFQLSDFLIQSLHKLGITEPTPVQAQAIPIGLEGHDVLANAETGSGKTLAYLLPAMTRLEAGQHALILLPTRELALQVYEDLQKLLSPQQPSFDAILLIGGMSMRQQIGQLQRHAKRPRSAFFIGTPGRIVDHLHRRNLSLKSAAVLVLDETDRMLDMGFEESLNDIMAVMPEKRQTFMFSATLPKNIERLAQDYLHQPKRIEIGSSHTVSKNIHQTFIKISQKEKFHHLLAEIQKRQDGSIIVFVKTKIGAEQLAERLRGSEQIAEALHGDLRQQQRQRVLESFRTTRRSLRILVATDVAARGLHIDHVKHVINYDLPQCAENYIHRIGRTGRAGLEGNALSFVVPDDRMVWRHICRLAGLKDDSDVAGTSRKKYASTGSSSRTETNFRSERRPFGDRNRVQRRVQPRRTDRFGANQASGHNRSVRSEAEPRSNDTN